MVTTVYGCVAAQEAPTTGKAEDGGGGAAKKEEKESEEYSREGNVSGEAVTGVEARHCE